MKLGWKRLIDPKPDLSTAIDALTVFTWMGIALYGFRAAYGGSAFFVAAMVGVVLGLAISYVSLRLELRGGLQLLLLVVAYFLFGGLLALGSRGIGGLLPGPSTLQALGSAAVHGWKELLTIEPPVGNALGLYALPYALGLLGATLALDLMKSTDSLVVPALPPTAVLALSILFGSELPVAAILQGSVFAGTLLLWWTWRFSLRRATKVARRSQLLGALAVIVIALLLSPLIAPRLPFAQSRRRVVLTQYVVPPLNASDLSSPLAGFRVFTPGSPQSLAAVPLFRIRGAGAGSFVRIATMNSYNGLVWGFGNQTQAATNAEFAHFGATIPEAISGDSRTVEVTLLHPVQAWLPDLGAPTSFHFVGVDANTLATDFFFDYQTLTAADAALSSYSGQVSYTMTTLVPQTPTREQLLAAGPGQTAVGAIIPTSMQALAQSWTKHASGAWQRVELIAENLKSKGRFSNGTGTPTLSLPGESLGRLESFLAGSPLVGKQIVGDDEQFAATLALLSNAVGVPARVVLGAVVPSGGTVYGRDMHAWVEVELAGLGWIRVPPSMFLPTQPPIQSKVTSHLIQLPQTPIAPPLANTQKPPPVGLPSSNVVPNTPPPPTPNFLGVHHLPKVVVQLLEYLGIPIAVIAALVGAIGALKSSRRRRRRQADPRKAIAGGWWTLMDTAVDLRLLGQTSGMTRLEIARRLTGTQSLTLAGLADLWSFGPEDPTKQNAVDFWNRVEAARRELIRSVSRVKRWRGYLSLTSILKRRNNR